MPVLTAGFGSTDITPPVGLPMCGSLDSRKNEGIDDPLHATAMVVESDGSTACIVQVDLIGLPRKICDRIISIVNAATGIPSSNVMITCTHTHSGPYTKPGLYSFDVTDNGYLETLPDRISAAVLEANGRVKPAVMNVGRALVYSGLHYRRAVCKDGKAYNTWMSDALDDLDLCPQIVGCGGPIDPELWVLRFDDAQGNTMGVFVNFTCHVNSHFGNLYSADYPGVMANAVRESFGDDVSTVFTPGACANINPTKASGNWLEDAERFAAKTVEAAHKAREVDEPVLVSALRQDMAVSRRDPRSDPVDAVGRLKWGARGGREDIFDRQKDYVATLPQELIVPLNTIRIGPLAIASNPGELFVEHGLTIKQRSPFPHTVVAELTNDLIMYQPTRKAFEQQGYETLVGPNRVSIEGIERIVETSAKMLQELWSSARGS